jgi:hypothetical protein
MVFREIKTFRGINGWTKDRIVIFDASGDPENSPILFKGRVRHHWPSQDVVKLHPYQELRPSSFTLHGQRVRVFRDNDDFDLRWRRQCADHRIEKWLKSQPRQIDLDAMVDELERASGFSSRDYYPGQRERAEDAIRLLYRKGLSVEAVEAFAELVDPRKC